MDFDQRCPAALLRKALLLDASLESQNGCEAQKELTQTLSLVQPGQRHGAYGAEAVMTIYERGGRGSCHCSVDVLGMNESVGSVGWMRVSKR